MGKVTDKKPAWRKPNKTLKEQIADLSAAVLYTLSPDFPAPNDDAARIAYLRAWWSGEDLRAVAEEPPSAKEDFQ